MHIFSTDAVSDPTAAKSVSVMVKLVGKSPVSPVSPEFMYLKNDVNERFLLIVVIGSVEKTVTDSHGIIESRGVVEGGGNI